MANDTALDNANLENADLFNTSLCNTTLNGANLRNVRLYHANLANVKLIGASLFNADLAGANLCGADLTRARLESAILIGAQLTGAKFDHTNNVYPPVVHPDTVRPFKRSPELECFGEYEPVANDPYAIHEVGEVDEARARMWHAAHTCGRASAELASCTPKEQVTELETRLGKR